MRRTLRGITGAPTAHSSLRAAALRYAANGWPVFLLGRSKRPVANCRDCPSDQRSPDHDPQACKCLTCHGFYAATLDPMRIVAMFGHVPTPMLAIRTGYPSGLVVVDVDPAHGGNESLKTLVTQGLTPPTAYVRTGSGGLHLYYRHPCDGKIPGSQGKLGPGIDVKADGGYVVAAPSIHPRTRLPYVWEREDTQEMAPPPLVAACRAEPATPAIPQPSPTSSATPAATSTPGTRGEAISHPDLLMATLVSRIRQAPEGKRRVTLYGCARGAARLVTAGHLTSSDAYHQLVAACENARWPQARTTPRAIVDGFRDEGVTV